MNIEKVSKGFATVGKSISEAVELWHVIVGAVVMAASIVTFGAVYFQTAQAADVTHKEIQDEQKAIRSDMAEVHSQMNTNMHSLQRDIEEQKNLILLKIQQDNLKDVNRDISANKAEMFRISQWVDVNGRDPNSAKRLKELEDELELLNIKRNCIINNNRACD